MLTSAPVSAHDTAKLNSKERMTNNNEDPFASFDEDMEEDEAYIDDE